VGRLPFALRLSNVGPVTNSGEILYNILTLRAAMPTRRLFLQCFGASLSWPTFAQNTPVSSITVSTNNATGPRVYVQVDSVSKVFIAKDSPAYLISYNYAFGYYSTVYLQGLGAVPAKGSFVHLVKDLQLDFRDSLDGPRIVTVPLQPTVIVAAKPPLNEVPGENQFPSSYRSFTWGLPISLQERANVVLGHYFHYLPHENDKLTYLATTYTPLSINKKLSDSGVLAQVALLLSFPYDPETGKYSFHVQSLVKEGRALSDTFQSTNNPDIVRAADGFVDKLVAEMKVGQTKP
jgi:hypothetical protein